MVMKIIYLNELNDYEFEPSCVALGFFDGIHLGHRKLIDEVIAVAKENDLKKALMTFDVHPKSYLLGNSFKYLMSLDDKIKYLENLNFDYLFVLRFNHSIADFEPRQFINEFIIKPNIKHVVCGFDFHFGFHGIGDANYLKNYSDNQYEVTVINKLEYEHKKISSSYIRNLLADGKIELANILLDRFYQVNGIIIHGRKNGRKIGFPTINVDVHDYVLPKNGVYGVKVVIDGNEYLGMANLGYNPTFKALEHVSLEVNIFNFNQDVYGKNVTVLFINHIRSEQKFDSINDLIEQLNQDKQKIIKMLG